MSYVLNDPATFADESAAGFVAAHRGLVRRVPGGVARTSATPDGHVAVVIGGGSGHYPAFAGLIGEGLAHAAAMGNVFASPSAQQVYSVAKSVATEAGVLLSYGNYAGDALNFDIAQRRLNDEGIPCRTVRVTDDIYSASPDEMEKRRGIAGDFAVFRAAGWAAAQGRSLDEVFEIADRANRRTRSLGVAFTGCTLPGAEDPLFTVPAGHMGVGMGIHGEPGIDVRPLPTATELAKLFVDGLLGEIPESVGASDGARVGVIVNGLGAVKGEELFLLYGLIAARLEAAGITVVEPEVGEYATSFEMAGVSLTLLWLDDELEQAWTSSADAPAYRKGAVDRTATAPAGVVQDAIDPQLAPVTAAGSEEAAAAGLTAQLVMRAINDVVEAHADELGRLDAIAGDGDHGIGMQRGTRAAVDAADRAAAAGAGAGTVLSLAGDAWADKAGGTSGALWGAALRAAGVRIGDSAQPSAMDVAEAVAAGRDAIQDLGKAEVGDKTLVDALVPFAAELSAGVAAELPLAEAWTSAASVATAQAKATSELLPRMGRARPHMEKSLGTPDPGAISLALAMTAAASALAGRRSEEGEAK
ncbi:dihydroxyacetone kinase family protein [Microbacterium sp. AK031]|uniref:dihydroxyacetone kinase family protein n=1 Tax=Microbacterium sp. AK031 TaxID=2723076 RepID=UPI002169C3A0|nr:dihydroxyacetone kinase family protein [Microbacterium sp. AK031]MCS3842787.1 dihydroxyacetone kinase [Microbacterium sp. AK031]